MFVLQKGFRSVGIFPGCETTHFACQGFMFHIVNFICKQIMKIQMVLNQAGHFYLTLFKSPDTKYTKPFINLDCKINQAQSRLTRSIDLQHVLRIPHQMIVRYCYKILPHNHFFILQITALINIEQHLSDILKTQEYLHKDLLTITTHIRHVLQSSANS